MPRNATRRAFARANRASVDASMLQPAHHEPQTFTKTGLPPSFASASGFPESTSRPAIRCLAASAGPAADTRHAAAVAASKDRTAIRFGRGATGTDSGYPAERSPMAELVADYVLRRLREWGVHRIYGYPGDGINAFLGALDRADGDPEFIQTRHEETAAFMACGHAKFTGDVGVCIATSGPGAIHLLNGLYDAKLDHAPVVAIVGQQKTLSMGGDYQQEVDLVSLFKDVAHEYVHVCESPSQARHLIDRAVRIALATRSV